MTRGICFNTYFHFIVLMKQGEINQSNEITITLESEILVTFTLLSLPSKIMVHMSGLIFNDAESGVFSVHCIYIIMGFMLKLVFVLKRRLHLWMFIRLITITKLFCVIIFTTLSSLLLLDIC